MNANFTSFIILRIFTLKSEQIQPIPTKNVRRKIIFLCASSSSSFQNRLWFIAKKIIMNIMCCGTFNGCLHFYVWEFIHIFWIRQVLIHIIVRHFSYKYKYCILSCFLINAFKKLCTYNNLMYFFFTRKPLWFNTFTP